MKKSGIFRKMIAVLMLITMVCAVAAPNAYAASGTFSVSTVSGNPGDSVTIAVSLQDNPGIITARLSVSYDSALKLTAVNDTGLLPDKVHGKLPAENPYNLCWDGGLLTENVTENGVLA